MANKTHPPGGPAAPDDGPVVRLSRPATRMNYYRHGVIFRKLLG